MQIRVVEPWEAREQEVTPEDLWLRRRDLLRGAALAAGTLLLIAIAQSRRPVPAHVRTDRTKR